MHAIYGPPAQSLLPGGLSLTVDLVTVHDGRVVSFRWPGLSRLGTAPDHLWLPWDQLDHGEAPGAAVVRVLSQWTGRTDLVVDARMADLYSLVHDDKVWHVSFIFRVVLREVPAPIGHIDGVEVYAPEDLPESLGWFPAERLRAYLAA